MQTLFPELDRPSIKVQAQNAELVASQPLAYQLNPKTMAEFVGQQHLLGEGQPVRQMIEQDKLFSLILWGPPGCGKTSLARFISQKTAADFVALNAVTARVADVKTAIDRARLNLQVKRRTIVFIDEIHRFSKAQQDALLPETESGLITLIGATTENPFFYVIPGLISRAQVLELQALAADDLAKLIERAVQQIKTKQDFEITPEGRQYLVEQAKGDARKLLTLVEMAMAQKVTVVERDLLVKITQNQGTIYNQDMHYDLISAYIKSMRASDATGAIYWLARMLKGGEDPGFVARRMVIFASEDVGNADPQALLLANAALDATKVIGMPEVQINLAQVTHYLAAAPKSRAAYEAIAQANQQIEQGDIQPVPPHLRPHP